MDFIGKTAFFLSITDFWIIFRCDFLKNQDLTSIIYLVEHFKTINQITYGNIKKCNGT